MVLLQLQWVLWLLTNPTAQHQTPGVAYPILVAPILVAPIIVAPIIVAPNSVAPNSVAPTSMMSLKWLFADVAFFSCITKPCPGLEQEALSVLTKLQHLTALLTALEKELPRAEVCSIYRPITRSWCCSAGGRTGMGGGGFRQV